MSLLAPKYVVKNSKGEIVLKRTKQILPEAFLNQDEIVQDLKTRVDGLEEFRAIPEDDLIMCHHGFGTWIRNTYGLWMEGNPHLNGEHPDDFSFNVIMQLHKEIQKDPFEEAKKVI